MICCAVDRVKRHFRGLVIMRNFKLRNKLKLVFIFILLLVCSQYYLSVLLDHEIERVKVNILAPKIGNPK